MVTRVKVVADFSSKGKYLIVGLPGMGKVGYVTANYFVERFSGRLVAEIYSSHFPPQLLVGKNGISTLFIGKLYDIDSALVFTADTQPPSTEGQNEVCDALLSFLSGVGGVKPPKGYGLRSVVAGAAFVVPQVGGLRKVFVAGNEGSIIRSFVSLGAEPLSDGVITGINGAIVGWAKYYGVPAAVVLGETWAPIVEFDETDYRAAKRVIEVLGGFMGIRADVGYMDSLANAVEGKVINLLRRAAKPGKPAPEERKEVL